MESARVKVYELNDEGQWDCRGTGNCNATLADDGDGEFVIIVVLEEETDEILLEHRVGANTYERQCATVIMWQDVGGNDFSLSFHEQASCEELWQLIMSHKGEGGEGGEGEGNSQKDEEVEEIDQFVPLIFPLPELTNLAELEEKIGKVVSAKQTDSVAKRLGAQSYLDQLFVVFRFIELDQLIPQAHSLFNFVKGMFLINNRGLLEMLTSEVNILDVIACLEYDPLLPVTCGYQRHRTFLRNANFKEPVSIPNSEVISCIHLTYRITYIRDVILLKYLDDSTLKSMGEIITANNYVLLRGLLDEKQWVQDFFSTLHKLALFSVEKLNSSENELETLEQAFQRKNVFLFLQELCLMVKTMHSNFQSEFYKFLIEQRVLEAIENALAASCPPPSDETWLWLACADILTISLVYDPGFVRSYIIEGLDGSTKGALMNSLIDALISPSVDTALAEQIAQVIRMIVAPESMSEEEKKSGLLDDFYSKYAPKLVIAVSQPLMPGKQNSHVYHACELLSYCVYRHKQLIQQFVLQHDVTRKVSRLIRFSKANIVCTGIRFLRACLSLDDHGQIARQMCNDQILDAVVDAFVKNGARYNLLNSTIIELFHFIRLENIKVLIEYLVKKHGDKFQGIGYVSTFEELKLRYEQNEEYLRNPTQARSKRRKEGAVATLEGSEYSYFERDSDDEHETPTQAQEAENKAREYKLDLEMLKKQRPRNADDEADLVAGPLRANPNKRKPSPKPINIAITSKRPASSSPPL